MKSHSLVGSADESKVPVGEVANTARVVTKVTILPDL